MENLEHNIKIGNREAVGIINGKELCFYKFWYKKSDENENNQSESKLETSKYMFKMPINLIPQIKEAMNHLAKVLKTEK